MTFAAALLAAWEKRSPGARPNASEAAAAVLLDRAGVTPADVEAGRVLVHAGDGEVRDALHMLARRIWPDALVLAEYCEAVPAEAEKRLVFADGDALRDVGGWMQAAGERGDGVLMAAGDVGRVHEAYRIWATSTVSLDPVDVEFDAVARIIHLVAGRWPLFLQPVKGLRLSDLRAALGPHDASERALGMALMLRDQRDREIRAEHDKVRERAEAAAQQAVEASLAARHERDTPLSRLSGFGDARKWGLEVAADLAAYRQGELAWADCDRGVLLSGAPGVGKTRFARALAAEAGVRFFPSSFSSLCGGSSSGYNIEKGLRKLFDEARKAAPCIVFLDEMDSVPGRDFKPDHNSSYFNSVNNSFLEALDGAEPRDGVVVIAATNYPERIDQALKRPGRLDREIAIPMPDIDDLAGIVRHHLGVDCTGMEEQVRQAAKACRGMSPADVEQACRDARRRARRLWGRMSALPGDVVQVVRERRGAADPRIERLVAVHEAGHAVAALALGLRMEHVDADRRHTAMRSTESPTAAMVEAEVAMTLAGRAAEAVVIGEITNGSRADLAMATKAAVAYHAEFGFGAGTGLLALDVRVLDEWGPLHDAAKALVDRCHGRALSLIRRHRANVERVAAALQRDRYLDCDEVRALMRPTLSVLLGAADEWDPIPEWAPSRPCRMAA